MMEEGRREEGMRERRRGVWRRVGGEGTREERNGESSISEQLMFSCAPHTHLLFSEVDVS